MVRTNAGRCSDSGVDIRVSVDHVYAMRLQSIMLSYKCHDQTTKSSATMLVLIDLKVYLETIVQGTKGAKNVKNCSSESPLISSDHLQAYTDIATRQIGRRPPQAAYATNGVMRCPSY